MRRPLVLLLVALAGVAAAPPAPAQAPGPDLVEVCTSSGVIDIPELGPRACHSLAAGSTLFAQVCSQLPIPPEACANVTDGRVIDPALIDAFEQSWLWRALRLQDRLDDAEPLRATLWTHTHNSSNSTANAPSLSNLDPNQRYSVLDQLRMGVRAIELDLHWVPNPAGTAETGGKAVVLCHGRSESVGDLTIHLGCSVDRLLVDGLRELRAFLDTPGNEDEVVLLYLENQLEDDPLAHELAAAALDAELGTLVARPPADQPCAEMPMDTSTDALRATGARVLIVGNCGPGAWGAWVHERGPRWDESGIGDGYAPYPECIEVERIPGDYDANWTRIWEDSTWLTAMVDGGSTPVTPDDVRSMVACGVDMIGFDRLEPDDGRLEAMVWSWAPDEPADDPARRCAGGDTDGRFRMAPCDEHRHFACRAGDGSWVVPEATGPASEHEAACIAAGAAAATPPTGWENERLRAAAGGAVVWLDLDVEELGLPVSAEPSAAAEVDRVGGGALPATGPTSSPAGPAVAVLAAVALATVVRAAASRP